MNRKQLRAINNFKQQDDRNLEINNRFATATNVPRDRYRGTYRLTVSGGTIPTTWIGRTNSINGQNQINIELSGNQYYGDR